MRESERQADAFACIFLNFIFLLTGILTFFGILFAEPIISLIAPNLDAETAALAASLLRIMFPMIIFTGAAYTLVGVLQSKNEFIIPSLISSISNAGVILYFLFVNDALGENAIQGLAFAYLIAWGLQLVTLIIPLAKRKFPYRFSLDLKNPALRKALKMTPPIMIGSWLAPFGVLSGTFFSPYLPIPGAITLFEYTNNIYVIIVGILTYGICNFTFPKLSRLNVLGEHDAFSRTARSGLLSALYVVLPIMAAVMLLSGEGTAILYQRGEFDASAASYTANALKYISIGMPAFCIIEIVSRIMYSLTKVRVPMLAAALRHFCQHRFFLYPHSRARFGGRLGSPGECARADCRSLCSRSFARTYVQGYSRQILYEGTFENYFMHVACCCCHVHDLQPARESPL